MDFLIYCKIHDQAVRQGLVAAVKGISDSVFDHDFLIMVANNKVFKRIPEDMIECLQDNLSDKKLSREDEIFVFYPQVKQLGVWLLKRKGRLKIRKWPKSFPF